MNVYNGINSVPMGHASSKITEGCLVLEGGAWRGLYSSGVLDALMLHDINFRKTIGISAGALFGLGYVSGQIGWTARIDLITIIDVSVHMNEDQVAEAETAGYDF